jgi:hypothetical protein
VTLGFPGASVRSLVRTTLVVFAVEGQEGIGRLLRFNFFSVDVTPAGTRE